MMTRTQVFPGSTADGEMDGLVFSRGGDHFAVCPFLSCQQWSGPNRDTSERCEADLRIHMSRCHGGAEVD